MTKNLSISVCVPAFNEERNLEGGVGDLLSTLSPLVGKLEVIIVDDGSTDSTLQVAEELARKYYQVKVIHHKNNLGIGVCYRDALSVAGGDYYTWFPGDHENSAEEFIRCLPYVREDAIVTCYHYGQQDTRSVLRRCISYSYTWILNTSLGMNLKYYNGLAIIPTAILSSPPLVAEGFAFSAESIIRAVYSGYKVIELTAPLKGRACGRSKAFTLRSLCNMGKDLLHILIKARRFPTKKISL